MPAGFAVYYTKQSAAACFIVNFFAIIPSNAALGFAIEEVNLHVGDVIAGLLSMSFSNAAQLISSILLLKTRQVGVLRASLLGGILQNLLLMTGLAFLLGGIRHGEQAFNPRVAQTIGMLLLLAVLSLTIPTVSQLWGNTSRAGILAQSRGTAVVIMCSYVLWLFFQLKTNRALFDQVGEKAPKAKSHRKEPGDALKGLATIGAGAGAAVAGGHINQKNLVHEEPDEEEPTPQLTRVVAVAAIVLFTALLTMNTQFATDSIQGIMATNGVSESFMGIVILPILSNDPLTIDAAIKDKMDMSLALTLERCMQTALMVVPLIVLISWGMHVDTMTLDFDGFSVAALFASIIIVTYVVQEGKSNW